MTITTFTIDLAQFALNENEMELFLENDEYVSLGSVESAVFVGSEMTLGFELGDNLTAVEVGNFAIAFESETVELANQAKADAAL